MRCAMMLFRGQFAVVLLGLVGNSTGSVSGHRNPTRNGFRSYRGFYPHYVLVDLRGGNVPHTAEASHPSDQADAAVNADKSNPERSPAIAHPEKRTFEKETITSQQVDELPSKAVRAFPFHLRQLWTIPLAVGLLSFACFSATSHTFHEFVQWASSNTWIPKSESELNLQTNVITQVVNGPVITSVSILFASLASMTISSLHARQQTIRQATSMEVHTLKKVRLLWQQVPPSAAAVDQKISPTLVRDAASQFAIAQDLIVHYTKQLEKESYQVIKKDVVKAALGERQLLALLSWSYDLIRFQLAFSNNAAHNKAKESPMSSSSYDTVLSDRWISTVQQSITTLLEQRQIRLLAYATRFPFVHWCTLTVLAMSIAVSFLVAIDQQAFLMQSLQVRILWAVLMGSFTSLAVLCYDLGTPFEGAYNIS